MKSSIYTYSNYEDYFSDVIEAHSEDRGYKTRLAQAVNVHPSYITRISKGVVYMTPDQAASVARFWGFDADESEYLLWLVLKSRTGDENMKQLADQKMNRIKLDRNEIGHQLSDRDKPNMDQALYYTSWMYSAVHMLLSLPQKLSVKQLSQRLSVSEADVQQVVDNLVQMNFAEKKEGYYKSLQTNIHLSNANWISRISHQNWRVCTAERAGRAQSAQDFKYTAVHSISKKDFEKLQRMIKEFVLETDRMVRPSPEETVCVMCVDLFEL